MDPKDYAFPNVSPYTFNMNNPIMMIDPGGDSTVNIINYALSEADAEVVKNEIKSIFEKNGIKGLDYKILSPDQAKGLKLGKTDAMISLRNDMEPGDPGFTEFYGLLAQSQDDGTNKNTYVNLNAQAIKQRETDRASYLYAIAFVASHEITHQFKEKAHFNFFGNWSPISHDNSNINLNSDGYLTPIPKNNSPFLRPAETLSRCDQNMISNFIKQFKKG